MRRKASSGGEAGCEHAAISSSPSRSGIFRSVRADRLLTPCLPERDGRRAMRLKMGLVANQVCSLEGGGEPTSPAKQFEMVEFPVSPPVSPMPACRPSRIRDSSLTLKGSLSGCSPIFKGWWLRRCPLGHGVLPRQVKITKNNGNLGCRYPNSHPQDFLDQRRNSVVSATFR